MIIQQCRLKASATPDQMTSLADWTVTGRQTSLGLSKGPAVSSGPVDVGVQFMASEVAEWPR